MLEEKRKDRRRTSLIGTGNINLVAPYKRNIKNISCNIIDITFSGDGISILCDHELYKGQVLRLDMGGSENELFVVKRKEIKHGRYQYGLERQPPIFDGVSSG